MKLLCKVFTSMRLTLCPLLAPLDPERDVPGYFQSYRSGRALGPGFAYSTLKGLRSSYEASVNTSSHSIHLFIVDYLSRIKAE